MSLSEKHSDARPSPAALKANDVPGIEDGSLVNDRREEIIALEQELEMTSETIEALTAELTARESEISNILNSRSWRWMSRVSHFKQRYVVPAYEFFRSSLTNGKERELQSEREETFQPASESPKFPSRSSAASRIDVVCFPIIDWDVGYQRPQQMMSQFAMNGHRVFYLRPGAVLPPNERPRFSINELRENLFQVTLAADRHPWINQEDIRFANAEQLLASLDELRRAGGMDQAVAYVMTPSWTSVALEARRRWGWTIVYDCMDEWNHFRNVAYTVARAEQRLARECDSLVVTAQRLQEKWRPLNRPMLLVRNAVDFEFYAKRCRPNTLLAGIQHPIVGYYGAIADWFDVDLIIELATKRPHCTFVLLGRTAGAVLAHLKRLPNVRLLGQQPYETMPQYLYHFDVCLIPFKTNAITRATDPVKVYEYLSCGKPVVSVALPELEHFRDLLYVARDRDDFLLKLDDALAENDPEMITRRRNFAAANTWQERYETIIAVCPPPFRLRQQTELTIRS